MAGWLRKRRCELIASAWFLLLIALFLREALLNFATHSYTTADVTQYLSPTASERGYVVRNTLLTDPVTQFLPWFEFSRNELFAGRIPLWNPFNGCGQPHLANYQSAVFSPFSLPYYVLSLKLALLASAAAKLFLISFGTFVFLRRLRLSAWAAWFGGAAFAYCGHNTLLLAYPHTAVIAWLPFQLAAVETIARALDAECAGHRLSPARAAWITLVATLAAAVYSGQPETLGFAGITIALYALGRLGAIGWRHRSAPRARGRVGVTAANLIGGAVLAAALGAPQLATFFEYLPRSGTVVERIDDGPVVLDLASWPRYFFPDLLGNPATQNAFGPGQPPPNYEAATLGYVGASTLLLALAGVMRVARDARVRVFVLIAACWLVWAHDVFGAAQLAASIPLLRQLPIPVSQAPWALSVAVCAAFTIDSLWRASRSSPRAAVAVVVSAALALAVFTPSALQFSRDAAVRLGAAPAALDAARTHVLWVTASFALGSAAFALALASAKPNVRTPSCVVIALVQLVQTSELMRPYNSVCPDSVVFPRPPQLEHLRAKLGGGRLVIVGERGILAASNAYWGIEQLACYDALDVHDYLRLYRRLFRPEDGWRQARQASSAALSLFGVNWLMVRLEATNSGAESPWTAAREGRSLILRPHGQVGEFELFEYTRSQGRYWIVGASRTARDTEQAFELVTARGFDALSEVVLGPEGASASRASPTAAVNARVEVLERLPGRVRLATHSSLDSQLVTTIPWYPGWRATVDGRPTELARANFAFSAVPAPAGQHEIVLEYAPRSWSIGVAIAALGAAVALALLACATWRQRAGPGPGPGPKLAASV